MYLILGQLVIIVFVYLTFIFDLRMIFSKSLCVRYMLPKNSIIGKLFIRKNTEHDPYLSLLLIPVIGSILMLVVSLIIYIMSIDIYWFYWIFIIEIILLGGFRLYLEILNKSYYKKEEKITDVQFDEIIEEFNQFFKL